MTRSGETDADPRLPAYLSPVYREAAGRIMDRCDQLAAISSLPEGIYRSYLTPEHERCNALVAGWMKAAGLSVWQDAAANICGRWISEDPDAPCLLLGSHLDTVMNAGKYDGILGVLLAIETLQLCRERGRRFPFHIDVIGFGDEEGARFGTTLLGSRAVAGTWNADWMTIRDRQGVSLAAALRSFGCDPHRIGDASRAGDRLLGYLEVHIEQGPVLEENRQPLGVVPSIAGARRFRVTVSGRAGHAGTVPMAMRQDALVAAANAVGIVEQIGCRFEIVATVGQLQCYPGAPNVIPGEALFSVDIRAGRDAARDLAVRNMQEEIEAMMSRRGMRVHWEETHNASAVACAGWLQRLLEDSVLDLELNPISIVSGAGHDAMALADITDVGMLFVRCAAGVSHDPTESIEHDDVAAATAALERALYRLEDHVLAQEEGA